MADDNRHLKGKKVYARRPFGYAGLALYQGEIFELGGHANDELLLRFRYCDEVPKFTKHHEHGATGRKFIEAGYLEAFGRAEATKRHDQVTVASAGDGLYGMVDTTGDAELRRLNQDAPLDVEAR